MLYSRQTHMRVYLYLIIDLIVLVWIKSKNKIKEIKILQDENIWWTLHFGILCECMWENKDRCWEVTFGTKMQTNMEWTHHCSEVSLIIWWNSSWPLIPWLLGSSISYRCCCGNGVQGQHVFLDLYWKSQCQHSICSAESWVGGGV